MSGVDPGSGTLPGGQSGTDGSDSTGGTTGNGGSCCNPGTEGGGCALTGTEGGCCGPAPQYAPDEHIDSLSVSVDDLFELVGGTRTLPGEWTPSGDPVALTIEIREIDGVTMPTSCGPGDFATVAHVFTSDGSIDGMATNIHLAPQEPAIITLDVPTLPASRLPPSDAEMPPELTISLRLTDPGDQDVADAVLSAGAGVTLAKWSSAPWTLPKPVPSLYAPPDFMASACASAPAFSFDGLKYTPLDSEDQARSMAVGNWIYCQQPTVTGTVGFNIAEDGSVHDLILDDDGNVVAAGGFGHESTLLIADTSAMNDAPGLYQIGAGTFGGYFWQGALAGGDYMHGVELLLPTDAVFAEPPNPFDSMARAGSVACGTPATDFVAQSVTDTDGLRQRLAGSWTRCSGSLPNGAEGFAFDASSNTLTFEDAQNRTLSTLSCEVRTGYQLNCGDANGSSASPAWFATFATRPLMLQLTSGTRSAIFSALP